MKRSDLQKAVAIIEKCNSFLLAGHINPDGDCLGSICALTLVLSRLGKRVTPVSADGVPDPYTFMPGSDLILTDVPPGKVFDAGISIDSDRPDRLGSVMDDMLRCGELIVIDHHIGSEWERGVQLIDPSYASCGEIVYQLLLEGDIKVTHDIAECILTAIITDTGNFRFSNVKSGTLRAAADMVDLGVPIEKIAQSVYETRTPSSLRLLGMALCTLTTEANGRIAYAWISQEHIAASGASDSETEGIVNYIRSAQGAEAGVLFKEASDGNVRVSFRTSDTKDISQVARLFGGGGHRAAAGCTIEKPLNEAIELVLGALRKWMEY